MFGVFFVKNNCGIYVNFDARLLVGGVVWMRCCKGFGL